jgi:hypothetical protein
LTPNITNKELNEYKTIYYNKNYFKYEKTINRSIHLSFDGLQKGQSTTYSGR